MARPLPTIPGTVRCSIGGLTATGRRWANILHFRYAGGASSPGTTEIDNLDVDLFKFYSGTAYTTGLPWLSRCATSTSITQIDYTVLDGAALAYSKPHSAAGSSGTTPLPGEVAACLTLRTTTRGRRYRGRIYLPAPSAALIDSSGYWTGALRTGTIQQWTDMAAALNAKQWRPVVASYGYSWIDDPSDLQPPSGHSPKILSTWTPFCTEVNSVTMDQKPDVQRRRK
jgi:hypothetical protein